MSRSYKKPVAKLNNCQKMKKHHNKNLRMRLRNGETISSGNSFKKYNYSWEICDYSSGIMKKEIIKKHYKGREYKLIIK